MSITEETMRDIRKAEARKADYEQRAAWYYQNGEVTMSVVSEGEAKRWGEKVQTLRAKAGLDPLPLSITMTDEDRDHIRWCEENEAYWDRRSEELRLAGEETKAAEYEHHARTYGIWAMTLREEAGLDPNGPPL